MIAIKNNDSIPHVIDSKTKEFQDCTLVKYVKHEFDSLAFVERYVSPILFEKNGELCKWEVSTNPNLSYYRAKAGKVLLPNTIVNAGSMCLGTKITSQSEDDIYGQGEVFFPFLNPLEITIGQIYSIDRYGFHDEAMNKLYSYVYDLYIDEQIREVDLLMEYFLTKPFSINLMIAFARISKPHKEQLSNRILLIDNLKDKLEKECSEVEAENILFHIV